MLRVYRDEKMPGKKEISLLAAYGPMTLDNATSSAI